MIAIEGERTRPSTRADGWPLCPVCGDDELWSHLHWNGSGERPPVQVWIDAGLTCYACGYDSMRFADHYPWSPTDDEHRAMIADVCAALGVPPALISVPPHADPAPAAPALPPATPRYQRRYGVAYCTICNLDARYCTCAFRPNDTPSQDPDGSDLARRIRACQGGQ